MKEILKNDNKISFCIVSEILMIIKNVRRKLALVLLHCNYYITLNAYYSRPAADILWARLGGEGKEDENFMACSQ